MAEGSRVAVGGRSHSTDPQPPVGQISLNCHTIVPKLFVLRRCVMSLFISSASPMTVW